jgi:hypothetical protein
MDAKGTPNDGWRLLKAKRGARLMRSQDDESLSVLALEGMADWKAGLLCVRFWTGPAYGPQYAPAANGEHYTVHVFDGRERGDDTPPTHGVIATVYGRTNREAWQHTFAALRQIGVMPSGATE